MGNRSSALKAQVNVSMTYCGALSYQWSNKILFVKMLVVFPDAR
jgi:hypothetical protein